jgi:hypothetical protein
MARRSGDLWPPLRPASAILVRWRESNYALKPLTYRSLPATPASTATAATMITRRYPW